MAKKPEFAFTAREHGTLDQDSGQVPSWCNFTVAVQTGQSTTLLHLTSEAAQEMADVIHKRLHPYAGMSILEIMKRHLDEVVDRLMAKKAEPGDKDVARGMAMAMAILYQPLNPDWEKVRDDAMLRYNARNS